MHKYSRKEDEFLINNVKGITLKELTKRFNAEFKTDVKESSIANRKMRLGLRSGITGGQFKKGHVPANKGKKGCMSLEQYQKCKATMFKKGHVPANHKSIGSERIDKRDGTVLIKVQDGKLQRNWMPKGRYVYEQAYGKIPKGYKVIFADGDNRNFDLNNLVLVSNAEELIMNRNSLLKKDNELTKVGVAIAKLLDKVNKRKKDL